MRRGELLTIPLLVTVLVGCAVNAPLPEEPQGGLVSLESAGGGATLILSGILTRESFTLKSMRVVGSRLAGKGSDPDQFRVTLLGITRQELETVKMWSPLRRSEWDRTGQHESATTLDRRAVKISIPVSLKVHEVVLSWPGGKEVARVKVSREIYRFCARSPLNSACKTTF